MGEMKITRELLRGMADGESVTVTCESEADMESQRNTAYAMQRHENCTFVCTRQDMVLEVVRINRPRA